MIRNTQHRWGSVAKSLHWSIVLLIAAEIPVGFLMSYTYTLAYRDHQQALPLHTLASQIHHTIGFSILALALLRLAWRYSAGRHPPPGRSGAEALGAGAVHGTLYALLLCLPLSGWSALSVYRDAPLWLFNRSGLVPPILPRVPLKDPHGYAYFARIHVLCLKLGLIALAIHVGAAFWHHFIRRDEVLKRMWPLTTLEVRDLEA